MEAGITSTYHFSWFTLTIIVFKTLSTTLGKSDNRTENPAVFSMLDAQLVNMRSIPLGLKSYFKAKSTFSETIITFFYIEIKISNIIQIIV